MKTAVDIEKMFAELPQYELPESAKQRITAAVKAAVRAAQNYCAVCGDPCSGTYCSARCSAVAKKGG